jgi:Prion-inhibition and propagation
MKTPGDISSPNEMSAKRIWDRITTGMKFVIKDKKKLEEMVKELCYLNDSLHKLAPSLDQESSRRQLRTRLHTTDIGQLRLLRDAAALLHHRDIEQMADTKFAIEEFYLTEMLDLETNPELHEVSHGLQLNSARLKFHGVASLVNQVRCLATYNYRDGHEEIVLVDWRSCRNDEWRRTNPAAFQRRTENLAKILNKDLSSLKLNVLHCIGYTNQHKLTGYLFRPPSEAQASQEPVNLHEILSRTSKGVDIPSLGDRFELAKALVSTVFEFHNLGWVHKNLQSKNVLFWPESHVHGRQGQIDIDFKKPYLLGFDISRPGAPAEESEKPMSNAEDDLYRHPAYKGLDPKPFIPPYDIYSLGLLLFEIGMWRVISSQSARASRGSVKLNLSLTDPQFIRTVVSGPAMDLARYMGDGYRDAVMACLSMEFDHIWHDSEDTQKMLTFQNFVQKKIVDPIAFCRA